MHLDLLTLGATESLVTASAGAVLVIAWLQNRKASALALWGIADIVDSAGIACLVLASSSDHVAWVILGSCLLTLGKGLIWKAARTFELKPAPLAIALLGTVAVGFASSIADTRDVTRLVGFSTGAIYLLLAAATLWRGREERLRARWPVVILTVLHAAVLLTGLLSALNGTLDSGEIPAIMSLFGFIHLENNVFTIGTSVFLLALVKERKEAASQRVARLDPLTGIANRAAFMKTAARMVKQCRRENLPVSVIMCDLDRFKAINDTCGHAIGDAVIKKFCETVTDALWPDDIFGRLGGEEFAIVLPRANIDAAYVRAERMRILFAESCCLVEGHQVNATVSCGVSVRIDAEHTLSALLKLSDQALYRAKADGRNRVKRADQAQPVGGDASRVA